MTSEIVKETTPPPTLDQIGQVGKHHLCLSIEVERLGVLLYVHLLYADRTSRTAI
jgi:hypothetical protein